jgi:CBS domain-containing protein
MITDAAITDLMTPNPATIERSQPISEAYSTLSYAPFNHLVVTEQDELVGMLSMSDILRLVYDADGTGDSALRTYLDHQFTIEGLMNKDLRTISIQSTIAEAADALSDGTLHAIPVVDDKGDLMGLVTSTDLIRYLRELF